ncbi:CeGAL family transcription factor [Aspergillus clavatus NRRL 1]|uniref:Fungal specific transcription factor domain protein n=1 Tax=Aspergillus clavatus (strain ATCC 1007 / CBS 513.65 / DSM 816 / NCTC 3887 / NRRL 1 / QM 1276 / 107) TaxID=344612 RepID=A1CNM5_ASPCL|nr:fungal specific transcription factor domain protein [Aspergillus clavatus NRRL 1]EAW07246.1 fungal specific transcription factor domain protein [Aspergillus clavatus NRRL 1]
MAIPRLTEGAESAFTSPGRFHRRHVRRACESCRQRKTKCTGDKSGCRNCREAGIICCYTDGKREKSKRQLASLSAKVQAYEDVIRKLSSRFGVSDERLMSLALAAGAPLDLNMSSDMSTTSAEEQKLPWNPGSDPPSRQSSVGPHEVVDHTKEDFNRDETARATGYIGKSSVITWLQKLNKEVNQECETWAPKSGDMVDDNGMPSPSLTPRPDGQSDPLVASSNYYLDDLDIPAIEPLDTSDVPSRDTATKLLNEYLHSVHPSFPIIGISTFVSQFQVFFNQPSLKPGRKWLAILNLIFAIAAKYAHLTDADWKGDEDDDMKYFSKARALSLDDQLLHHPDLQQLQVEGLTSFYLLASGHINRAWKLSGSAIRGAFALGLHLRNVGVCTSDTSKEIRYRVWWSLYTLDHLLCVMTGRPSCILDSSSTTPLPVPFDECDFQKEEVVRMIGDALRCNSSQLERIPSVCSSASDLGSSLDHDSTDTRSSPKDSEINMVEYLKSLAPCMSLYFLQLTTLTSINKRMTAKLYGSEVMHSPWPSKEFTIQSLMLELDSWFMNLPAAYDFTSTQTSQCPASQRMSLALLFYSTKIGITRPCLCRLDSARPHGEKTLEFCSKTAAECVESACHMLTLFPDTPDAALLFKLSPWWCILHYLMQSATILLLELAFHAQHVPEKASMVSKAAKKALEWLSMMSRFSLASERAWRLCDGFLRRLAPHVGVEIGDVLATGEPSGDATPDAQFDTPAAAAMASASADNIATELDSMACSPMNESDTSLSGSVPFGLDSSDIFDFMKTDKSATGGNTFDDLFPCDTDTGQITGSFFPPGNNMDLDLGCFWSDPIFWKE